MNKSHHYPVGATRQEKLVVLKAGVREFAVKNADKGGWALLPLFDDAALEEMIGIGRTVNSCCQGIGVKLEKLLNGASVTCDSGKVVNPKGEIEGVIKSDPVIDLLARLSPPLVIEPVAIESQPEAPIEPKHEPEVIKFEDESKSKKNRR